MSTNIEILLDLLYQLNDPTRAYTELNRLFEEITQNLTETEVREFLDDWHESDKRTIQEAVQFVAESTPGEIEHKDIELRNELQRLQDEADTNKQILLRLFGGMKRELDAQRDKTKQ